MLSIIKKLLGRKVYFKTNGSKNHVSVMDSNSKTQGKSKCLFSGHIDTIDFDAREVIVRITYKGVETEEIITVPFDVIVTFSRMEDGRLRMWIKTEED